MPEEGSTIKFENYHKQLRAPFVIYDDFEALTEKIQKCQQDDGKSFTEKYQKHVDCGFGYKVVCCYNDKYSKPIRTFRGENAAYKFMEKMIEEVNWCKEVKKRRLRMTKKNEQDFDKAEECHICGKAYYEDDIHVRDHCHVTGKYRGSAHQSCK